MAYVHHSGAARGPGRRARPRGYGGVARLGGAGGARSHARPREREGYGVVQLRNSLFCPHGVRPIAPFSGSTGGGACLLNPGVLDLPAALGKPVPKTGRAQGTPYESWCGSLRGRQPPLGSGRGGDDGLWRRCVLQGRLPPRTLPPGSRGGGIIERLSVHFSVWGCAQERRCP